MNKNSLQKLLSHTRRAIADFNMIQSGDKIVVGVSGGKDSLTLLAVLAAYKRFSPQPFELSAVTIDMGFKNADFSLLSNYVASLGVDYRIIKTDIAEIIFDIRKEKSPCSLCSKMRRGALNTQMIEMGYNKLALGHHRNDLLETFFLSMIYEGRLSTFQPVSYMDRTGITLIRPLIYVEEKDIKSFAKDLPVQKNPCTVDHHTQREYMKNLIKDIQSDIPFAFSRMSTALLSPDRYNLIPPIAQYEEAKEEEQLKEEEQPNVPKDN